MGPGLRRDDESCGALVFDELLSIQFSNSSRQLTPSLPGSTRQSILFENGLAKIDGCRGMTSVDISTPNTRALAARSARGVDEASAQGGRGERRVPVAPAASRALCIGKKHTSKRVHRNHPTFPHAMVLTAYVALSPVTGLFCHRRPRICFV